MWDDDIIEYLDACSNFGKTIAPGRSFSLYHFVSSVYDTRYYCINSMSSRKGSSSKGLKRPREDDNEDKDDHDDLNGGEGHSDAAATPAQKGGTMASPPGTTLRSGRKVKPRRSLEEKMERATKRAKLTKEEAAQMGLDDDDDDDSEEDNDDDDAETEQPDAEMAENQEEPKKPAAAAKKAAAAASKQSVGDLRLPSQHTPGKPKIAALAAGSPPPAAAASMAAKAVAAAAAVPVTKPVAAAAANASTAAEPSASSSSSPPPPPPTQWRDESTNIPLPKQRLNLTKTPHKPPLDNMAVASPLTDKLLHVNGGREQLAQRQQQHQGANDDDGGDGAGEGDGGVAAFANRFAALPIPPAVDIWLSKPWVCFFIIGLLMVPRLFFVNPFLDSAVWTAKAFIPYYKMIVPFQKPAATVVTNEAVEITEIKRFSQESLQAQALSEQANKTRQLLSIKENIAVKDFDKARDAFEKKSDELETQMKSVQALQAKVHEKVAAALLVLQSKTKEIQDIASRSKEVLVPKNSNPNDVAEFLQSLNPTDANCLVDFTHIQFWEPQMETCDVPELDHFEVKNIDGEKEEDEEEEPFVVTKEVVLEYLDELKEEMNEEFGALKRDKDWRKGIIQWFEDFVDERLDAFNDSHPPPDMSEWETIMSKQKKVISTTGSGRGSNEGSIRKIVNSRLEVDRADRTGRIDFAALHQGASIVRTGSSATSPSLVDNLPLFNRFLALMGTQFYGYGPEAALSPSYPADALGQCWSFVEETEPNRFGSFAMLTVKLSKPIFAQSVSIEHPLPTHSNKSRSAIRNFRVYGFTDDEGETEPYKLGQFSFDFSKSDRQLSEEFELERVNEEGGKLPRLRLISLVVDSTWGRDYACLYRFRVHGKE